MFAVEFGLGGSGPNAAEGLLQRESGLGAEFAGQLVCLIALPPLFAAPVQRDGNDDNFLFWDILQSWVLLPGFAEDRCEVPGEVESSLVFEGVNEMECGGFAFERSNGEFKVVSDSVAIGAVEFLVEIAIKWLTAFSAGWLMNTREFVEAGRTKGFTILKPRVAELAECRVDEIEESPDHREGVSGGGDLRR